MHKSFRPILALSLLTAALLPASASADEPILPLSAVTPGMSCTAKTVFAGETPTSFPVTVRDIYRDPSYGNFLLIEVGGAASSTGIAQGMSGSPVYCPGPQGPSIAGAISYNIGWENNQVGLATPIEVMLSQVPSNNSQASKMPNAVKAALVNHRPIPTPMVTAGLSPQILKFMQKRSPQSQLLQSAISSTSGKTAASSVKAAALELNPGDSMGASFAMGDWSFGGIGTVSYRQGDRIWAFGHPFFDVGNSSMFLTTAPITTIVDAGPSAPLDAASYKLGVIGQAVGSIDNDSADSISGQIGAGPETTNQTASVKGRSNQRVAANIASGQSEGYPYGNMNQMFAGASLAEAAYRSLGRNFVPNFSSRTCWKVTVSQSDKPFSFCQQLVSRVPIDWFWGPAWPGLLVKPESEAVQMISEASYEDLTITSVRSDAKTFANLQAAELKRVRQVGRVRKGVAKLDVTYKSLADGQEATSRVNLRVGRNQEGRRVTLRGAASAFPLGSFITNLSSEFETQGQQPSLEEIFLGASGPEPAGSEEELRDQLNSLNGSTRVKVTGLRGGSRLARVDLGQLIPLGSAGFRVR